MRAQHILIVLFSLLVSSTAIAADWIQLYSDEEYTAYVDKQSIKRHISNVSFWTKIVFKKQQLDKSSDIYYVTRVDAREADCKNDVAAIHETRIYAYDGNQVRDITNTPPTFKRIVPGSVADIIEKYVCSFKQAK